MCGIVGCVLKYNGGFYKQTEDTFFEMLFADTLRGWDSTGVIAVQNDKSFHIMKEALDASYVIPQIKNSDIFKQMNKSGKVWVGHNRKSTVGKTNDENAHPFVVNDEFAFVHNGTLFNHEKLAKTDVDSMALAQVLHKAMGEEDYIKALEDTLGEVYGAYATAWYDQRKHKLFLLRNKERPLCVVETTNAYYFASEGMMAGWILARNGYSQDGIKFHVVPEHVLISFDLKDTKEMKQEVLVPKKAPPPFKVTKGGTGTNTKAQGTVTKLSAKQIKNFRRAHVCTKLKFWCDDWVEKNFPFTLDDGETEVLIMGEADDTILIPHGIRACVDLKQLQIEKPEDITDRPWTGNVVDIEYDDLTGSFIMHLEDCKPVVRSTKSLAQAQAIDHRIDALIREAKDRGETLTHSVTPTGRVILFDEKGSKVYESPVVLH